MMRLADRALYGLIALLVAQAASAGDAGRETPFSLGGGARALGMGGGFTSLAEDATAVYYNPSGLARLEYQETAFTHTMLFEGTVYDFASWAYPISAGSGIGIGYMRLGTGDIIRRENYAHRGEFDYSCSQLLLAYGRDFGRPLAVGANLKIVNQSLADYSDYGVGLDVGLSSRISDNLSVGVIAREIVPAELKLAGAVEQMPWSMTAGVSLSDLAVSDQVSVTLAMDVEELEDRGLMGHAGIELLFRQAYALRSGWDRDNFTFGAGFAGGRLRFDYAYKLLDYVDNTHHFSVSFLLGRPVSERVAAVPAAVSPPLAGEEREVLRLKEKADSLFRRFQLDSAIAYYTRVHDLDSTDEEVAGTISAIQQALRIQLEQEGRLREAERDMQYQYLRDFYASARVFYVRKYYSAALDLLDLIFDIEPDNTEALLLKSKIQEARAAEISANLDTALTAASNGRTVRAVEAYNRIIELDPDNQEVIEARQRALDMLDLPQRLNLGINLFDRGRLHEAQARFEAVLKIKPGEPVALEYLKKIEEHRAGRTPSTLEDLQKDERIWQHYLNGLRHMRNGEYQEAIDEWEQVLTAYPNNPNTLNNIEQARLRLRTE